jgi:TRAP-type C4-dicarboxylate transport system permease small subunit
MSESPESRETQSGLTVLAKVAGLMAGLLFFGAGVGVIVSIMWAFGWIEGGLPANDVFYALLLGAAFMGVRYVLLALRDIAAR